MFPTGGDVYVADDGSGFVLDRSLNTPTAEQRLEALESIADASPSSPGPDPEATVEEVNNHVHTIYSFSPYSPSAAAYAAWRCGLRAVGSVDHDSISAAPETTEAGEILGIATTVGYELRVGFGGTALAGRKINNPDSHSIAYYVTHGVPHGRIDEVKRFLAPINTARNRRNRTQVQRLNELLVSAKLPLLDFERDVLPLSCAAEGGSVTERHILAALAQQLVQKVPDGGRLTEFVCNRFAINASDKHKERLDDETNPHRIYDLLGFLKSELLPRFFVQPGEDECVPVFEAVDFSNSIGAIPAYAYLGDVGESPTGDKKAEKFEDDYLDELFDEITRIGFCAVTYMPPRNTKNQLLRVQALCRDHGLMEISGVDINSSRQSFHSPETLEPEFAHLSTATWALIAHEHLSSADAHVGLFSAEVKRKVPDLTTRLEVYEGLGRKIDFRRRRESVAGLVDELREGALR